MKQVKARELKVGDVVRVCPTIAFGGAQIVKIEGDIMWLDRPFLYSIGCSADIVGTFGIEHFSAYHDSDYLWEVYDK